MSSTADFHSSTTLPLTEDKALDTSAFWTVPFRNGLPTPPSDMTGVTYNAMPSVPYGKPNGMPSHLYSHRPFDSISSSMMAAMKPQSHSAPAKEAPVPTAQKKSSTSGSQLRIPSSINNSKGNLAEFAAQVSIHKFYLSSEIMLIVTR